MNVSIGLIAIFISLYLFYAYNKSRKEFKEYKRNKLKEARDNFLKSTLDNSSNE